ncbi:hypothetical protein QBC36DRAFT_193000, partial [Triangularia setosa]
SDDDINLANGTCYYAVGKKANGQFIPCGNADFGHTMCCWAGSYCFSEGHTCFKFDVSTTYMAGCTDSTYEDSSCPDKKNIYSGMDSLLSVTNPSRQSIGATR